jgi:DNA-binding transcriptional MocR family regulator
MLLNIHKNSKTPLVEQLFNQITLLISNGSLEAGARLPSTRELAKTLGINRTTVIRVYEELWVQGYIESSPGSYTRVRKRQPVVRPEEESENQNILPDIYDDHLHLQYDQLMHYLENGEKLEKNKINFLQLAPDTRLLDRKRLRAGISDVFADKDSKSFDFAHARGYPPLRKEIVKHAKLHSIYADDKNILVTSGSLQSLQLIFQVFSKPGDYIAVENPSYSIVFLLIKIFGLQVVEIPITPEGMDLQVLKKKLKEKPIRFIYTMPTCHNPTGISMPQNRREELLSLIANHKCILIEDSLEEEMIYSGKAYLPLKSIDTRGQVIYMGAFTKILAPGLRLGWIIGTQECIKKLTVLKSIFEISTASINQIFLCNFINQGAFELHLRKMMRVFRKRMKVAINSVRKYIPAEKIEWTEPSGGYMLWLKLLTKPVIRIENHFSEYGVLIHNGRYFFLNEQNHDYIRICIARTNEAEIEEGIKRIGEAIRQLK